MKKLIRLAILVPLTTMVSCIGHGDDDDQGGGGDDFAGAVYAMTNKADQNSIVAFGRLDNGKLEYISEFFSEGQGTGQENVASGPGAMAVDPLASNYSLVVADDRDFVFMVNAGSDEVSSFYINDDYSLEHVSTVSSGGADPVSIAQTGSTLYVNNTNAGMSSLVGFHIGDDGSLSQIDGSERTLQGRATAIRFSSDYNHLVVAEVDTNTIQVFGVNGYMLSADAVTYTYPTPEAGRNVANPFGLDTFSRDGYQYVAIAEARVFTQAGGGPAPQSSSISTFKLNADGSLDPITMDLRTDDDGDDSTGSITACWVVANEDDDILITSNTNSSTNTSFYANAFGEASLNEAIAFSDDSAPFTEIGFTDIVIIGDYFYQMYAAEGSVNSYRISNGSLQQIDSDVNLNTDGGNQGIDGF